MPVQAIVAIIKEELGEMTKSLADKIFLASIATVTTISTAQAAEAIPVTTADVTTWIITDYAIALSMISIVMVILERAQTMIYKRSDRRKQKNQQN